MSKIYDAAIIGAGTAGVTAAIYLRRAGKSVIIFEKDTVGGQIVYSAKIENYPGIKSVSGGEYADVLYGQALSLGAVFEFQAVTKILGDADNQGSDTLNQSAAGISVSGDEANLKTVITGDGSKYFARTIIAALGVKHKKLGIEREDELLGEGVSYCALCDGAFFKGQNAAVVGGGNTALSDAAFLSSVCKKVFLIHRREELRGDAKNVEILKKSSNVEFILNSEITGLIGGGCLSALRLFNNKTQVFSYLSVDCLFIAIGQIPSNSILAQTVELDRDGFIAAPDCITSAPGIFAAGDCRQKTVRQLTTAASDGAIAAVHARAYIDLL